jgi:hypothetical protein
VYKYLVLILFAFIIIGCGKTPWVKASGTYPGNSNYLNNYFNCAKYKMTDGSIKWICNDEIFKGKNLSQYKRYKKYEEEERNEGNK